jgi:glyoxylate reductase
VEEQLASRFDSVLPQSDGGLSPQALRAAMPQADALLCSVVDRVDTDVLSVPDARVRLIANFGTGVDHIDLDAARRAGVLVTNTPDVLTEDTADLTMAIILAAARRMGEGERSLRAGAWQGWRPTHMLGRRVTGATLGIVGMGRIGQAVARRAAVPPFTAARR